MATVMWPRLGQQQDYGHSLRRVECDELWSTGDWRKPWQHMLTSMVIEASVNVHWLLEWYGQNVGVLIVDREMMGGTTILG